MPRLSNTQAILGEDLFEKIRKTPVLVVGAGGIGCELLKNLVLVGFGNIEIVDLDTIDLSNLNRQFLFRKPDISKPKALVAAATARHFNPSSDIKIHARHGNVKDAANDLEWMKGFGLVMNALDNMDARRHVNKLCQAAGVPLIESGTAGYLGQVTPIMKDKTECFDCVPKPTPKSFPVCTIRATPSEPIHCIVWAKSYLFGKLFGEDDEAVDQEELDQAQAHGENAEEITNLRKEAAAFREVRNSLGEEDGPIRVFQKVFNDDLNRLLAMDDLWRIPGRVKPTPLDHKTIMGGKFAAPPARMAATASAPVSSTNGAVVHGQADGQPNGATAGETSSNARQLRDQRDMTLKETLELFVDSCRRLSARAIAHSDAVLSFDKDDDDTLDFVLATANLRATAYGIANKTRFQVKEMAGNIIPAIATTNAIIAGLIVMQAMNILNDRICDAKNVFLKAEPTKPLGNFFPQKPDEHCAVCRDVYVPFKVDTSRYTLGEFVLDAVQKWLSEGLPRSVQATNGQNVLDDKEGLGSQSAPNGTANGDVRDGDDGEGLEWIINDGPRILSDPDFDDNHEKTLAELGVERGRMLTVVDEDAKYRPIHFCVCEPDRSSQASFTLPDSAPAVPLRPPRPEPSPPIDEDNDDEELEILEGPTPTSVQPITTAGSSRKRGAPDDGDVSVGTDAAKKRRVGQEGKEVVVEVSQGVDDEEIQLIK